MVSNENFEEGLILARPIYDENARILLNIGTILTLSHITRLKKRINFIYVKSAVTENIEIPLDDISYELRLKTTSSLANVFSSINTQNTKKEITSRVKNLKNLKDIYNEIISELHNSQNLLNLLSNLQINRDSMFEHSLNTSLYSLSIGKAMGIKEQSLYILGLGALFHDIGKLQLPKEILTKNSYSEEEKHMLRLHTEFGFDMLRKESELHLLIAHCAYQHHENIDGSGYPRGLKGNEIHLFAKIVAVAEKFDYLIKQKALLPHESMEVLYGYCYSRYDLNVIEAFKKSVAIYPIGVTVTLSTGEKGVVIAYNEKTPQRPKVRIYHSKDGRRLTISEFYDVDLMSNLSTMIVKCDAIIERQSNAEVI